MSMTRDDYKKALIDIRIEVLDEKNPYELTEDAQRYLRIALNTMLQMLNLLDDSKFLTIRDLYDLPHSEELTVPIHLDNHPVGDKREESFNQTLFGPFVTHFNFLKSHEESKKHIQHFCSIMNGYCIEERTRKPFNYAESVMFGIDLNEIEKREEKIERAQPTLAEEWRRMQERHAQNNDTGVSVYHPPGVLEQLQRNAQHAKSQQNRANGKSKKVRLIKPSNQTTPPSEIHSSPGEKPLLANNHHRFYASVPSASEVPYHAIKVNDEQEEQKISPSPFCPACIIM